VCDRGTARVSKVPRSPVKNTEGTHRGTERGSGDGQAVFDSTYPVVLLEGDWSDAIGDPGARAAGSGEERPACELEVG
jgi:hypothetical protein